MTKDVSEKEMAEDSHFWENAILNNEHIHEELNKLEDKSDVITFLTSYTMMVTFRAIHNAYIDTFNWNKGKQKRFEKHFVDHLNSDETNAIGVQFAQNQTRRANDLR